MHYLIDAESMYMAMNYTLLSSDFTHNHAGWEAEFKKSKRIFAGQLAQYFIYNLLKINGVEIELDKSEFFENDAFDLKIKGKLFDVKCTTLLNKPMEITVPSAARAIDYYLFCRFSHCFKTIEILGFVSKTKAIQAEYLIPYQSLIPNTRIQNPFKQGSYIYTGEYHDFEYLLGWISRIKYQALEAELKQAKIFS